MSNITFEDVSTCTAGFLKWHWCVKNLSLINRLWVQQKYEQIVKELNILAKNFSTYINK